MQTGICSLIQSLFVTCTEIPSTKTKEKNTCSISPIWKEIFFDFPCPRDGGLHGLHHPGRHLPKSAKRLREHLWLVFFSFFKFHNAVKSKLSPALSRAKCPNCFRLLVLIHLVFQWFICPGVVFHWWSWFPSACVGGCCIYTTRGQRRGSQTPAWFEPHYGRSQANVGLREHGFTLWLLKLWDALGTLYHWNIREGRDHWLTVNQEKIPWDLTGFFRFELDPTAACKVRPTGETWKVRQPNQMSWGSPGNTLAQDLWGVPCRSGDSDGRIACPCLPYSMAEGIMLTSD